MVFRFQMLNPHHMLIEGRLIKFRGLTTISTCHCISVLAVFGAVDKKKQEHVIVAISYVIGGNSAFF